MSRLNWCFTLNNYTEDEFQGILQIVRRDARYFCIGRERGSQGTSHLQGYISFRKRINFNAVRDLICPRAHFEVAKGNARKNREYCSKDGDFEEGGESPPTGPRPDRNELARRFREAIHGGLRGVADFAEHEPGTWYFSGHNLLRNAITLMVPVERPAIKVEWLWGPPGVGKSRRAHEELADAYIKEPKTKWWNGYLGEKTVIIDDYGPQCIDINHLLRWFDRYKCLVENKGGMVPLFADRFIVTSNFHPSMIFKFGEETHPQLPALERRMTIVEMA